MDSQSERELAAELAGWAAPSARTAGPGSRLAEAAVSAGTVAEAVSRRLPAAALAERTAGGKAAGIASAGSSAQP